MIKQHDVHNTALLLLFHSNIKYASDLSLLYSQKRKFRKDIWMDMEAVLAIWFENMSYELLNRPFCLFAPFFKVNYGSFSKCEVLTDDT